MRLFISYARHDSQQVLEIVGRLRDGGHDTWWDRSLLAGDDWQQELREQIRNSDALVYFASPEANDSDWCRWEVAQAKEAGKRFFTILLQEEKVPEELQHIQWADFREGATGEAVARLLGGIRNAEFLPASISLAPPEPMGVPVGGLPKGSRMPYGRNPLFTGRAGDLERISGALEGEEVVALTGMGGVGKTQLAVEFIYRTGYRFAGGVHWLSFADPASVPAEVVVCGRRLFGSQILEGQKLETQVDMVKRAWAGPEPRVLVFDNLDDDKAEELLNEWRPKGSGARVLVTSRRDEWELALGVKTLPLGVLERVESVALLKRYRPGLEESVAGEIAAELGDLPLALDLAGSYLKRYERTVRPESYLAILQEPGLLEHKSLVGYQRSHSPTDHDLHVGRTFAISFERLEAGDEFDELARALLFRAAYFAPGEPIPWNLLAKPIEVEGEIDEVVEDGFLRLGELGLVTEEGDGSVLVHRLVAAFVQAEAREEGLAEAVQAAVEEVVVREASRINQEGYPASLLEWQGHLRYVADSAANHGSKMAGQLQNELGYHLNMMADYAGAKEAYQKAFVLVDKGIGLDHPNVATLYNNLGDVLESQGEYTRAKDAYQRALAIDKAVHGPDHIIVARDLNNLGKVKRIQGDYVGAKEAYQKALAIYKIESGPNHSNVATLYNNLGLVLHLMGDYPGAKEKIQQALAIEEAIFGPDHPKIATTLNNLAGALQALGNFSEAKKAYRQALAIDESAFGPNHPNVARDLNNLGLVLQAQGDYAGAKKAYQRALVIDEAAFGLDHLNVADEIYNLGSVLQDLGDYEEAKIAYERALAIDQATFRPSHPNIARDLNGLGLVLQAQGDYVGARDDYQRALAIYEKELGPDHPETRNVKRNLEGLERN